MLIVKIALLAAKRPRYSNRTLPLQKMKQRSDRVLRGNAIPIGHDPETNALPKSGILSALAGDGKSFLRGVGIAQTRLSAASSGSIQHGICNPTSNAIDFHKIM